MNLKLKYFLEKDSKNTWNKLKDVLLANDLRAWNLTNILKGDLIFREERSPLIGLIPETNLWEWVKENPNTAPYILTRMIPLHESEPLLHPLARKLLINYPNDENIASEISANWNSEAFMGPRSAYYKNKLSIAEKWAEDPESSVANWAKREAEHLKKQIKMMKIEEDERGF